VCSDGRSDGFGNDGFGSDGSGNDGFGSDGSGSDERDRCGDGCGRPCWLSELDSLHDLSPLFEQHDHDHEEQERAEDDADCHGDAHAVTSRSALQFGWTVRSLAVGSPIPCGTDNDVEMPTSVSSSSSGPDGGLTQKVLAAAAVAGIDHVGVADASPFHATREILEKRKAEGLHGGMEFTYRNPQRSTDPGRSVPGARSLVVAAWRYAAPGDANGVVPESVDGTPVGLVARYAQVDAYRPLRAALGSVAEVLRSSGHRALVLADDNSLVDRAAAVRAGLGWFGRNANVLLPDEGSWFVLGSVVTDAWLDPATEEVADGCGTCRRCLDGCPTGALVAPGVLDARRCLAWLVQVPGEFPRQWRGALGNRVYGCDECQEVCPPNGRVAGRRTISPTRPGIIDLWWLLSVDDVAILDAVGHWYIPGRDVDVVRRNALVALGNSPETAAASPDAAERTDAVLRTHLRGPGVLAEHAAWAALRLGRDHLLDEPGVVDRPEVVHERSCWEDGTCDSP